MAPSPSNYASVHRTNTSKRPYLALSPVRFSLTEGTSIPAPPQEIEEEKFPEPSWSVSKAKEKAPEPSEPSSFRNKRRGPLSSHPVTPIEAANGSADGAFPFSPQDVSSHPPASSSNSRLQTPTSATYHGGHQNGIDSSTANGNSSLPSYPHNPNSAMPETRYPQYDRSPQESQQKGTQRRQSFAERFLRFRSLSNFRNSWNGSRGSVSGMDHHPHPSNGNGNLTDAKSRKSREMLNGPHSVAYARGMKRPASPSITGSSVYSSQPGQVEPPRQRAASQSFPRMVRKKSMDLIGSARRMSGMFGREPQTNGRSTPGPRNGMYEPSIDGAMEDEMRRERMREEFERAESEERRRLEELERPQTPGTPPPQLPQVTETEHLSALDGEAMFKDIGR